MLRVINKEGVEVRAKAILIMPPEPKPPPWKKQPTARQAALAEEARRVLTWVCSEGRTVAQLPFGTTVRLVGKIKRATSGEEFCRVEAGDVAGWAMFSGSDLVEDGQQLWISLRAFLQFCSSGGQGGGYGRRRTGESADQARRTPTVA